MIRGVFKKHYKTIIICAVAVLLVFACAFISYSYAYWNAPIGSNGAQNNMVQIGEWELIEVEPGTTNFDDAIAQLKAADPLLTDSKIFILGAQLERPVNPIMPVSVAAYDVLLWADRNGDIRVVQSVAALSAGEVGDIFDTWSSFSAAVVNPLTALSATQNNSYTAGSVYTRAHAPVSYDGNLYLARHDNVTSTPAIGSDWFCVSESWLNQSYPVGAFVEHNGSHYRKVVTTNAIPGTDSSIWEPLALYPTASIPAYGVSLAVGGMFPQNTVAMHSGNIYVARNDITSASPPNTPVGANAGWTMAVPYSEAAVVPVWSESNPAQRTAGTVVTHNGVYYYRLVTSAATDWNPAPDAGGANTIWAMVENWTQLTGIQSWNPSINYQNNDRQVFEHNGQFYARTGTGYSAPGEQPQNATAYWRRVLEWDEAFTPPVLHDGTHPVNKFFSYTDVQGTIYFATVMATAPYNPGSTPSRTANVPHYRRVEAWSASARYYPFAGANFYNDSHDRRYHAYTEGIGDALRFWTYVGTANTNSIEEPSDDNPLWVRQQFVDDIAVTIVGGSAVTWDKNTAAFAANPSRAPERPSVTNNDWIRRTVAVESAYVFVRPEGGGTSVWRKNVAGATTQMPGEGTDWTLVDYPTGFEFVYTVNSSGAINVWRHPNQSSSYPGSSGWIQLHPKPDGIASGYYFRAKPSGGYVYYELTVSGTSIIEFEIQNAWVGTIGAVGSQPMRYYYSASNRYEAGDIVVHGITATNTYRYFRLRTGVNPDLAIGADPMSNVGKIYWEAVR